MLNWDYYICKNQLNFVMNMPYLIWVSCTWMGYLYRKMRLKQLNSLNWQDNMVQIYIYLIILIILEKNISLLFLQEIWMPIIIQEICLEMDKAVKSIMIRQLTFISKLPTKITVTQLLISRICIKTHQVFLFFINNIIFFVYRHLYFLIIQEFHRISNKLLIYIKRQPIQALQLLNGMLVNLF